LLNTERYAGRRWLRRGIIVVTEDDYRAKWRWDSVGWGSHGLGCYPGNCPYRVYVKDGRVLFEEQAGAFPVIEQGVPDMNPTGCQKGCAWREFLYGEERLLNPLKRAGEREKARGAHTDEALTEVPTRYRCGGTGPSPFSPPAANRTNRWPPRAADCQRWRPTSTAKNDDFLASPDIGKIKAIGSMDDWFHADSTSSAPQPSYTRILSRTTSPRLSCWGPRSSASLLISTFAIHRPVRAGEARQRRRAGARVPGHVDEAATMPAVKEQTDLPLLVRSDTCRFAPDDSSEDGRTRFYCYDSGTAKIVEAPKALRSVRSTCAEGAGDAKAARRGR
jgi:hypothetical protein